jgi:hypothetical protein
MRFSPARYVSFWAVPPPPGAEKLGYYNYKLHETLSLTEEGGAGLTAATPEVVPTQGIMIKTPVKPTEDFMGSELSIDEKTILRWFIVFKYPEGVSVEEGDDWYLNVHVKEVMQQSGLIRFFSYRTLPFSTAIPGGAENPSRPLFLHPKSTQIQLTHRVSEQWYENSNGWVKSNIESPPKYTKPPWAKYDKYPFLEPYVDFASIFLLERPSEDYLRDIPPYYI